MTQAVDTTVASGAGIRTDPAAGSQVAAGSTVVIYISRPQVATTTKVPSLIGMSAGDARTLLVQTPLGLDSQSEQYSDQPVGTVISQDPAAGATAKLNGRVNIVVSAGPEPAPEPEIAPEPEYESTAPDRVALKDIMSQTVDAVLEDEDDGVIAQPVPLRERLAAVLERFRRPAAEQRRRPAFQDTEQLFDEPEEDEE